jgi:hypothetical protein
MISEGGTLAAQSQNEDTDRLRKRLLASEHQTASKTGGRLATKDLRLEVETQLCGVRPWRNKVRSAKG